jgi:hypothetical protein
MLSFWQRAQLWLGAGFIFLWPSNLFFKFAEQTAYVNGLQVDYLIPKLYASDLVILAILFCWAGERWYSKQKKRQVISGGPLPLIVGVMIFFLFAMLQVVSAKPLTSLVFLARLGEMSLLAAWLVSHRSFFKSPIWLGALTLMVLAQSLIGLGQVWQQSSVFPSYVWLGETRLDQRAGLAWVSFGNQLYLPPYGTTAHPNILAGVLSIGAIILLVNWKFLDGVMAKKAASVAIALALITILFTQSWSAILSFGLGLAAIWLSQKHLSQKMRQLIQINSLAVFALVPVVFFFLAKIFPENTSIVRRAILNQAALEMFFKSPLTGVGLNAFTAKLEDISTYREAVRFVQPAHHVGLLMLAELGIAGVNLLGILKYLLGKMYKEGLANISAVLPFLWLPFLPIASLDHYLWTNQVGLLMVVLGGGWLLSAFMEAE